jgi:hypothetical protein
MVGIFDPIISTIVDAVDMNPPTVFELTRVMRDEAGTATDDTSAIPVSTNGYVDDSESPYK